MLYIWMFSNKIDLNQALRVSHIILILDLFENDWVPGNFVRRMIDYDGERLHDSESQRWVTEWQWGSTLH